MLLYYQLQNYLRYLWNSERKIYVALPFLLKISPFFKYICVLLLFISTAYWFFLSFSTFHNGLIKQYFSIYDWIEPKYPVIISNDVFFLKSAIQWIHFYCTFVIKYVSKNVALQSFILVSHVSCAISCHP